MISVGGEGMQIARKDIIEAARQCLRETKNCPKKCPLVGRLHCQDIILRETIKLYEELNERRSLNAQEGQISGEEDAQAEASEEVI